MSKKKTDRKIEKLTTQIEKLEVELRETLAKKAVGSAIDVGKCVTRIQELKAELAKLKM